MREFLLRGGFFMCDDFHGTVEWATFIEPACARCFPTAPSWTSIPPTPSSTPSTTWTIATRCPARSTWRPGQTYEKGETGKTPHWRAIYDDHGRIMVAMCLNMDLGDSWEHADNPRVSRPIFRPGNPHRRELHRLFA